MPERTIFSTEGQFDDYVGVSRGVRLLDQHPDVAMLSQGGRTVTFWIPNRNDFIKAFEDWMDEHDVQAYHADKSPEWVTEKVEELFSGEITDEVGGEMRTYRGQNYIDKSRYSDRQSIERDVNGPATLDRRTRGDYRSYVAFVDELYSKSL